MDALAFTDYFEQGDPFINEIKKSGIELFPLYKPGIEAAALAEKKPVKAAGH